LVSNYFHFIFCTRKITGEPKKKKNKISSTEEIFDVSTRVDEFILVFVPDSSFYISTGIFIISKYKEFCIVELLELYDKIEDRNTVDQFVVVLDKSSS